MKPKRWFSGKRVKWIVGAIATVLVAVIGFVNKDAIRSTISGISGMINVAFNGNVIVADGDVTADRANYAVATAVLDDSTPPVLVTTSPTAELATPTPELATPTPEPSPTPEPVRWKVEEYNQPDGTGLYCIWYFEYDNSGSETGKLVINGYQGVDFSGDLVWIYEGGFLRDADLNVKPNGDDTRTFYWNEDNGGHLDYAVGDYEDGRRVGKRTYWVLSGVVQPAGHDKEREPVLIDDILDGVLREGEYTKSDD